MRTKFLLFCLLFIAVAGWIPSVSLADETRNGVTRHLLAEETLPIIPGHTLTAVTVQLDPGNISAPHKHNAFVFVYLLEGKVRSQLDSETPVDYTAGESWIEPPGAVHTLTQNLSETETAKMLVVFVSKNGAKLTTSGNIVPCRTLNHAPDSTSQG